MKKKEIKKGFRYGKLTVVREVGSYISPKGKKMRKILCLCDCGVEKDFLLDNLKKVGHTTSCGCVRTKRITGFIKNGGHYKKHNMCGTPEYKTWNNMKDRCQNIKSFNYKRYGAKGITVCDEWNNFENFYKDMGPRSEGTSLDRIDSKGNYEPGNCRWATVFEQNNNLSSNRILEYKDKKQSTAMWARDLNLNVNTLRQRLFTGWSVEKALSTPVNNLTKL
jgi:hypothetical protein